MAFKVMVAEDEEITRKHLLRVLSDEGYEVFGTGDGLEALKKAEKEDFDLLITDIKMPGLDGLELLNTIKEKSPAIEVIVITGFGSIGSAVEAIRKGAYDYITKPFELDDLLNKVKKISAQKELTLENKALRASMAIEQQRMAFIAKSEGMRKVLDAVDAMRDSDCNVLLTGETGVGKSFLAKIIHATSRRKDKPLLALNCATFTEELLASELFGHEKGAFTGALKAKPGLVEIADAGTLFLDEISEIPPSLQAKLLKVTEEGRFFRVGGTKEFRVDVRFIAATNQNLHVMIQEGRFREDLYYRLNVMEIHIPSLRERKKDIEPLAEHFLLKHLRRSHKKIEGFTPAALAMLKEYSFPGNVRELENIVERAIILEKGALIDIPSLPSKLVAFQVDTISPSEIKTLEEMSRDYVVRVLEILGGNRSKASEMLGISRTSLWRILKEE